MTQASGRVPQISVVLGPAAGGAAYGPALTDIVILSGQGRIFVTGPDVVRSVTGEDVDMERLGGPEPHSRRSGVVHVVTETDAEALEPARQLAAMLGDQGKIAEDAEERDLSGLLPDSARRAYDVHLLTGKLLDTPGHRAAPPLGAEHRDHPRPPGRPHRRRRGQQPDAARRLPGRRLGGEGGALRADVRRVRRPARGPGGRARLPARRRPGMGRRGPPRRQAAARLRRSLGPAGDAGDPQGLRRRLHRDELPRRSARPASSPGRTRRSP